MSRYLRTSSRSGESASTASWRNVATTSGRRCDVIPTTTRALNALLAAAIRLASCMSRTINSNNGGTIRMSRLAFRAQRRTSCGAVSLSNTLRISVTTSETVLRLGRKLLSHSTFRSRPRVLPHAHQDKQPAVVVAILLILRSLKQQPKQSMGVIPFFGRAVKHTIQDCFPHRLHCSRLPLTQARSRVISRRRLPRLCRR